MQQLVDEAVEIMEEAFGEDKKTGMMFTGGKDSMVMLHILRENTDVDVDLLVIDTHNQYDEVYDFRERIAEEWDLEFDTRANEEFLEEVIYNEDDERDFAFDGFKGDKCCGALKIDVISDFISSGYEHLIIGRRDADVGRELFAQEEARNPIPHSRYHPLVNWSDTHIEAYISKWGVPLPSLYREGYSHTDCVTCVEQMMEEDGDEWSGVSQEKKQQLNNLRDMGYM